MGIIVLLLLAAPLAHAAPQVTLQWLVPAANAPAASVPATNVIDLAWPVQLGWTWEKGEPGGPPERPVLEAQVRYPDQFQLKAAAGGTPARFAPGHWILVSLREPLVTVKLQRRVGEAEWETGGLALTVTSQEPTVIVHEACRKHGLSMESLGESSSRFLFVGLACRPGIHETELFLVVSHDATLSLPGEAALASGPDWKSVGLPKGMDLAFSVSDSSGQQRDYAVHSAPKKSVPSHKVFAEAPRELPACAAILCRPNPLYLGFGLLPSYLSFQTPSSSAYSGFNFLVEGRAQYVLGAGWAVEGSLFTTLFPLLSSSVAASVRSLYGVDARASFSAFHWREGPTLTVGAGALYYQFGAGPTLGSWPGLFGPQVGVAISGPLPRFPDHEYRLSVDFAPLGVSTADISSANWQVSSSLGGSLTPVGHWPRWDLAIRVVSTTYSSFPAEQTGTLTSIGLGVESRF